MDAMAAIRQTFFEECEEQLAELESGLMAMNEGTADRETVNAVFRAVHSIKGGAGAFKLSELVSFAHTFETTLDYIRSDRLVAGPEAMHVMLRAADVLADLVRLSRAGEPISDLIWTQLAKDLSALEPTDPSGAAGDSGGFDFAPAMISLDEISPAPADQEENRQTFLIQFRALPELFDKANEPSFLFRELRRLGETEFTCDLTSIPTLDGLLQPGSNIRWSIALKTDKSIDAVRDVFEFVDGDCELEITEVAAQDPLPTEALEFAPSMAAPDVEVSDTTRDEVETAAVDISALDSTGGSGTADVSSGNPASSEPKTRIDPQRENSVTKQGAPQPATIRVDLDRVDRLINLVGELVINQAMLTQRVFAAGFPSSSPVMLGLDELEQLTREIQESVMAIRAQPVKPLFQRMSRIVREVCDATGKDVRLKTEGEATEIDKTVIERLADPLTHMIRNAVDHGIERADARLAAGKPAEGSVKLTAAHRSGRVVIEISDDGAGLNRPRILEKARAKGLVAPDAVLTESEIDNLLFLPGFSTADTVSNISGRGVGMDVVRRSIQALGGRISIASTPGHGSVFTMSLPLTLAILDGMIVGAADQTLVVPLTAIVETFKPTAGSVHPIGHNAWVVKVRDTFVPIIDVGQRLGFRHKPAVGTDCVAILVESETGGRHALLVDAIQDQRQVVIKSLESNYGSIDGIAAATILGDGRVALILDVDAAVGSGRAQHDTFNSSFAHETGVTLQ